MAHVFTLSITQNRVPRWLSEGISVFEEWRTGPTPGVEMPPRYLDAFAAGRFLPIAHLDEGFIRPSYEGQMQVSYVQAGLTCLYIEQRWGFPKLVTLLREFTRDVRIEAALQVAFGVTAADFDAGFNAFVKQRFAAYLADPKKLRSLLQSAEAGLSQKNPSVAIRDAQAAIDLLPEFTASDNAYVLLVAAELDAGDKPAAIRALQAWRKAGGWEPTGLRKLAALLQEGGRLAEATEVREAINYSDPLAVADHALLGDLLLDQKRAADALREFTVLLALDTQDPATAHLGVARAESLAGDRALARRHVLQALEIAPHFRPAQNLLLELRGDTAP
jgi:tetratricopeptide (TPR) repeat protein